MKIKLDYVTNSSTTCFILILKTSNDLDEDLFLKAIGVNRNSPFVSMFQSLYHSIVHNIDPIVDACKSHRWNEENKPFDEFLSSKFPRGTINRIEKALNENKKVYLGDLSSSDDAYTTHFCCKSFDTENEVFFLDATNDGW